MKTDSDISDLKKIFQEKSASLKPVPTSTRPDLNKISGIRYVIFDFYGTLFVSGVGDIGIDDGEKDVLLFSEALEACGFPANNELSKAGFHFYGEEITTQCVELVKKGYDIPEPDIEVVWMNVLTKLESTGLITGDINSTLARKFAVEFEVRMNPIWPMPGLTSTLENLLEKNLHLGIISNSQFYTPIAFEALMKRSISSMGFQQSLLHWSYAESLKKPSLIFYEGFIDKMKDSFPDSSASEVLFIGNDMLKDVYPAKAAGMRTALFAGDKRSLKWRENDDRCKNLRADLVITNLEQLPDCLGDH